MNIFKYITGKLFIPKGQYCYKLFPSNELIPKRKICKYWSIDNTKLEQENGYCSYLKKGDWELSMGLLWDMCKECNVNWKDKGIE